MYQQLSTVPAPRNRILKYITGKGQFGGWEGVITRQTLPHFTETVLLQLLYEGLLF